TFGLIGLGSIGAWYWTGDSHLLTAARTEAEPPQSPGGEAKEQVEAKLDESRQQRLKAEHDAAVLRDELAAHEKAQMDQRNAAEVARRAEEDAKLKAEA